MSIVARAFPRGARRCWVRVGGANWTCRCPPSVAKALRDRGWVPLVEVPSIPPSPQARRFAAVWVKAVAAALPRPEGFVHLGEPPYWCRRFGSEPCRVFDACIDDGGRLGHIAYMVARGSFYGPGGARIYINTGRRRITIAYPMRWDPTEPCWVILSFTRTRRGVACAADAVSRSQELRRAVATAARLALDTDLQLLLL